MKHNKINRYKHTLNESINKKAKSIVVYALGNFFTVLYYPCLWHQGCLPI